MQDDHAPPNFASKVPSKSFQLEPLNDAIGRLLDFLYVCQQQGMNDPQRGWSDDTWTEQYWPEVRKELELIWKRLPEDSREILPQAWDSYFEGLEDLLLEIKLEYFETPPETPRYPLDEQVIRRLRSFAIVLMECPEPGFKANPWISSVCSVEPNLGMEAKEDTVTGNAAPAMPAAVKKAVQKKPGTKKLKGEPTPNQRLLIAALTKHHGYSDGGCDCFIPVGSNELARLANIPKRNCTTFFEKYFRGHDKYLQLCGRKENLIASLRTLNSEFRPSDFLITRTPEEIEEQMRRSHDSDDD